MKDGICAMVEMMQAYDTLVTVKVPTMVNMSAVKIMISVRSASVQESWNKGALL